MFGRFTMTAATAAAVLTAAPAFAATENPVGGQMGGMWTQEAPTSYFNTEMGAVLAPRVQYISTNGGGLNFRMGLGSGTEIAAKTAVALTSKAGVTAFNANVGAGYKQQLTRAGNMALAFKLGGELGRLGGAGGPDIGIHAGLPMTFDVGTSLLSIYPMINLPTLTNAAGPTTGAMVGAPIGLQAPLANFWSLIGEVSPNFALGANTFSFPITVGARLSPAATSHVDFTFAQIPAVSPLDLGVGILGVTGHVGFR